MNTLYNTTYVYVSMQASRDYLNLFIVRDTVK